MATTNANESRAKDNYYGMRSRTDYRKGNNSRPGENGYKPRESSYKENGNKAKDNKFVPRDNTYKPRDNSIRSNNEISRNFDYKSKDNTYRKKENSFRSYSYQNNMDKDEDSDTKNHKGRKPAENKPKSSQSNDLEQSDKLETIKRLEREKKVIQRKNREEETEKPKRPIVKQKRSTKNWAKDYEIGILDEGDVF